MDEKEVIIIYKRNLGYIVKEIRIGKGLSQKYVVEDTLSQSNYSRFESGEIDIAASVFISILTRMDVDLHEFMRIYHKKNEEGNLRNEIIDNFYGLSYNNEKKIIDILDKIESYNLENNDTHLQLLEKVCKSLLKLLKNNDLNEARIGLNEVWEALSKRNQLFKRDIFLINAILYYFPLETIRTIKAFLYRNIENYKGDKELELLKLDISINFSLLLIKEKLYNEALVSIEESIKESKRLRDIMRIGICYVRKGVILSHIHNENTRSNYWIEKGLSLLEEVEVNNLIEALKVEIKSYKK